MAGLVLVYAGQVFEDIVGAERVQPGNALVHVSVHRVGLAGTGLPVGKASDLRALEGRIHQWSHS